MRCGQPLYAVARSGERVEAIALGAVTRNDQVSAFDFRDSINGI